MQSLLSPREVADALGVSESSVKRWVDNGELAARLTAGGHRRIDRTEVLRFARSRCTVPARPDLLSLVDVRTDDASLSEPVRAAALHGAFLADDQRRSLSLLLSAFLGGESIASLCDGPIRAALETIGEIWQHDEKGILVEHRATDTCLHALGTMRAALPPAADGAPVAVGSAGPEDPYLLPSLMCAASLAEIGFRDVNLGPRTPLATKVLAVREYDPVLVWHTASIGGDEVVELVRLLAQAPAREHAGAAFRGRIVAGGRGLSPSSAPVGVELLSSMREMQAFARGLVAALG